MGWNNIQPTFSLSTCESSCAQLSECPDSPLWPEKEALLWCVLRACNWVAEKSASPLERMCCWVRFKAPSTPTCLSLHMGKARLISYLCSRNKAEPTLTSPSLPAADGAGALLLQNYRLRAGRVMQIIWCHAHLTDGETREGEGGRGLAQGLEARGGWAYTQPESPNTLPSSWPGAFTFIVNL